MRRGFTLIEVMVASAVSLLLMGAMIQLFASGARAFSKGEAKANLQGNGLAGVNALTAELRRSSMDTLTLNSTTSGGAPRAVSFRVESLHAGQPALWTPAWSYVIYYLDNTSLVRKTWPTTNDLTLNPNPLVMNRRLTADEIRQICARPNGTERAVAHEVEELRFTPESFPALTPVTSVGVTLKMRQGSYEATVGSAVMLRNHR